MASSISITSSSAPDNRRMTLSCVQQSKSTATNKSTIKWTLSVTGEDAYYYDTGPTDVYINGTRVYHSDRVSWQSYAFPAKVGSVSGTIDVSHTTDGTKTISVSLSTAIFEGTVRTDSRNWTLDKIARGATITEAENFNDEGNPTITYSNPAGTAVSSLQACISLTGASDDIPYRDINISGTEYTFQLTTEERNTLRQASTGNTLPVKFFIKTVISGTTLYNSVDRTLTIVNATPSLTSATAVDVNSTTTALTGSNTAIVKGYSNLKISDVVATAYKYATLQSIIVDDIGEAYTSGYTKTINGYTKNNISIKVVDSRSNTSPTLTKSFTFVDYDPITKGEMSVSRASSGVGEAVTVKLNGTWFNGSFGSQANTLTATYRFKETSASSWTTGVTAISITKSGNNYSVEQAIRGDTTSGFNVDKSYNLEVILTDKLSTATFALTIGTGSPAIAILGNKIALGGKYDTSDDEEAIQFRKLVNAKFIKYKNAPLPDFLDNLNSIYPVGSIYMSMNNTNPSEYFGGTWEAIEGQFLIGANSTYKAGISGGSATHTHGSGGLYAALEAAQGAIPNNVFFVDYTRKTGVSYTQNTRTGIWANRWVEQRGNYSEAANEGVAVNGNTGSGSSLPPYLPVYMWKRTA